jgi:hypothetical protein
MVDWEEAKSIQAQMRNPSSTQVEFEDKDGDIFMCMKTGLEGLWLAIPNESQQQQDEDRGGSVAIFGRGKRNPHGTN